MTKHIFVMFAVSAAFFFCAYSRTVCVSVVPYEQMARTAAGAETEVISVVRRGMSAHAFDPSAADVAAFAKAEVYLAAGLPFEERLLPRLKALNPALQVVAVTNGCELIPHDPHLWLSISNRNIIAANMVRELGGAAKDLSLRVARPKCAAFASCHPSFNYLARDWGVKVISLEREGKEPTARSIMEDAAAARKLGVKVLVTEPQFPRRMAEQFANTIGARIVVINPLAEDSAAEIAKLVKALDE